MTREEENGLMATGSTRAVSVAAEASGGGAGGSGAALSLASARGWGDGSLLHPSKAASDITTSQARTNIAASLLRAEVARLDRAQGAVDLLDGESPFLVVPIRIK